MKNTLLKYRFFLGTLCVLVIYILTAYEYLLRHMRVQFMWMYLAALVSVLLVSSLLIAKYPIWVRLTWAILMTEIASVIGYFLATLCFLLFYKGDIGHSTTFIEFIGVAIAMPIALAKIYKISVMLLLFCGLEHYFFRHDADPKDLRE